MNFATFVTCETAEEYTKALTAWTRQQAAPIPVSTLHRPDLTEAVALSNRLYDGIMRPVIAEFGVLLGHVDSLAAAALILPLARDWITVNKLATVAKCSREYGEHSTKLLVVGTYDQLNTATVRHLLLNAHLERNISLGFLTGRDEVSLLWFAAKQWAHLSPVADLAGFFSDVDTPTAALGVRVFGPGKLDTHQIRSEILGRFWRTILFQGHGKDDSINLSAWTICGLNPTISSACEIQRPRCGYGFPCYKDEAKLIALRQVPAAEIVLSACNSGAMSDLALYDPKYILLLAAVDGCAQRVVSAVSVHDSDIPENRAWVQNASVGKAASVGILNESLRTEHPYPAFWQFGMPPDLTASTTNLETPPIVLTIAERAQALLVSGLLGSKHSLRRRLGSLNTRALGMLARRNRQCSESELGTAMRMFHDEVQSLDYAMVKLIERSPEDDLMHFGTYFADHGRVEEIREQICTCGRPAFSFVRRGQLATMLNIECVFCLRCGDTVFRFAGAPQLNCRALEQIDGDTLEVHVDIIYSSIGPVRVGIFVPSYMRKDTVITPNIITVKSSSGMVSRSFLLRFDPDLPPQAYYFTAFAIQGLAISTVRRHFGIHRIASTLSA